ncbi:MULTISPECIES: AAA family ATPase [unclassified Bacillus (in: firmicutes)]|uniref:AAA family ATPase n=1 Tax=unclassified Bacillus (in: firmicutes) TaxID=185979 RepID=UPI001BE7B605|nr:MULTISPECIES: AAA family ATPase [unclassified Bacillus (in: firmicutes)]MBT2618460.1 AAA family ATPase [Bacillus sp. ISL-78]MBT2630675.1 AAA family ATPase [Bacillus sp. ISL-101]MBT2718751.1 AAA family ATPase [Bacillus sp. ISL-57]
MNALLAIKQKLRLRDFYHAPSWFLALFIGLQFRFCLPYFYPNIFTPAQDILNGMLSIFISYILLSIIKKVPYLELLDAAIISLSIGYSLIMFRTMSNIQFGELVYAPGATAFIIFMVDYKRISHLVRPFILAFFFSITLSFNLINWLEEYYTLIGYWNLFSAIIFFFAFLYLMKSSEYVVNNEGNKAKINSFLAGITSVLFYAFYFAHKKRDVIYTYSDSLQAFNHWNGNQWLLTFSLLVTIVYILSLTINFKSLIKTLKSDEPHLNSTGRTNQFSYKPKSAKNSVLNSANYNSNASQQFNIKLNSTKKDPSLLTDPIDELEEMIGLPDVKTEVGNLVKEIKAAQLREKAGLKVQPRSRHLVFTGNPGTGKTTVARLIARIYASLGVLSKGHMIEMDRAGFIGRFIGDTEEKTEKIIQSALGGVLFIDEAYALAEGGANDFGKQAIDVLLKRMEDYKDDLIVIVAGYTDNMQEFISSNPGLESRFPTYIEFKDYSPDEMIEILKLMCKHGQYETTEEALFKLSELFQIKYQSRDKQFGNGRFVRNTYEKVTSFQSSRIVSLQKPNKKELMTIESDDVDLEKLL